MGYCIDSYENKFKMKKENKIKAFEKLYKYAKDNKGIIDGWSWASSSDILEDT